MKDIKKLMITLVALLAVTMQTWADDAVLLTTINASSDFKSGSKTFDNVATVTFSGSVNYGGGWFYTTSTPVTVTVSAANDDVTITSVKFFTTLGDVEDKESAYEAQLKAKNGVGPTGPIQYYQVYVNGSIIGEENAENYLTKIEVYGTKKESAPAVTVDWNKTSKTGTFTMSGGNVTLEPEYYPQATLTAAPTAADGAKATTDDLLVSGGTVATITGSAPAAPQGTLMYYVSLTNMSTEALLALDADEWVAEPTAAGITQKCGAFVYYYVKGNDSTDDALNFSDGDISSDNVLNVPIFPAPTYAVTFADDLAEPTLWTADPNTDVTKGQTVTVTYSGTKKVLGVKAEKKAGAATLLTVHVGGDTDGTLYYVEGETWGEAIQNHPTENAGFSISGNYVICNGYIIFEGNNIVKTNTPVNSNATYNAVAA